MKTQSSLFSAARIGGGILLLCGCVAAQWASLQNVSRCPADYGAVQQSLAIDSSRTLHACWTHRTNYYDEDWIEYACKPANADTWTIPVHVNAQLRYSLESVVAIGPNQVPYVIWRSVTDSDYTCISHRSADTWVTEQQAGWCNFAAGLRAVTDGFGRIHMVWEDGGASDWVRPV
jgi:hypothetical protein